MKKILFTQPEPLESRIAPAFAAAFSLGSLVASNGFKMSGIEVGDNAGRAVADAGDVNGDGYGDVIIGARLATVDDSGAAYVVFGKAAAFTPNLDLATLDGTNGFTLTGAAPDDLAGISVRAAGDVNGDGFGDLILGARDANEGGTDRGAAYVVFGKAGGFAPSIALGSLDGSNGFKLAGVANSDRTGRSVDSAGDVNNDGFADVIVGAETADGGGTDRGAAYVVFGKAGGFSPSIQLSALSGADGFKLAGIADGDRAGSSVAGAGDVNGDGVDDIVVGAPAADEGGSDRGAAYVIFGKTTGFAPSIPLASLDGFNGYKLSGIANGDFAGVSVKRAGDVNADGFGDIAIGAPSADEGGTDRGAGYIVFGKATGTVSATSLAALDGSNGFKLEGINDGDSAGVPVAAAGDVNGDGFSDLIVGSYYSNDGSADRGASYVIYGKGGGFTGTVALSALNGRNGFKIIGANESDLLGRDVSAAGDVNGDGFADLIVGAYTAEGRGAAYVIFGQPEVAVKFSAGGKIATFADGDGDTVTVKVSKGVLSQQDFAFGAGGIWQKLTLTGNSGLSSGTDIAVTVKKSAAGDGLVNLGAIDARGVDLGNVSISGDLGQIDAGDAVFKTPAIKSLAVASLGVAMGTQPVGTASPLRSDIVGSLAKLTVKGDMRGVLNIGGGANANIGAVKIGGDLDGSAGDALAGLLRAGGNIGAVTVKGSIIGGADFSGIIAGGTLGKVSIGGELKSDNAAKPVTISALGNIGATSAAKAVAIAGVGVKSDVLNARILAGYTSSLGAANADAGIGAVSVGGSWSASSLVAGVADTTGDGFGRNDVRIAGGSASIAAGIASVTIKGSATGSTTSGDFFGIVAERIAKIKIGVSAQAVGSGPNDILLDSVNNDFRVVDFV